MPKVNDPLAYARRIQKHLQPYQPPRLPNTPRRPYRLFRALALLGACSFSVWLATHQMRAKAAEPKAIMLLFYVTADDHPHITYAVYESLEKCNLAAIDLRQRIDEDSNIVRSSGICREFSESHPPHIAGEDKDPT